jgi:predicted acyl esterase
MQSPSEHNIPFEDVRVTTADGVRLHAWLLRPEDKAQRFARPTVLFFHENAGNMGLRSVTSKTKRMDVQQARKR